MLESEASTPFVATEVQFATLEPVSDPAVQVDPHPVLYDLHVVFVRLLQSQAQAGAASTKPPDKNPEPDRLRLALQAPDNLLGGLGCDRDHRLHLRTSVKIPNTPYGTIVPLWPLGVKTASRAPGIRTGKVFGPVEYYRLPFA